MKKNTNSKPVELPQAELPSELSNHQSKDHPKKKMARRQLTEAEAIAICFEHLVAIYGDNATDAIVEGISPGFREIFIDVSFNTKGVSLKTGVPEEDSEFLRVCRQFEIDRKTGAVRSMK